MAVEYNAYVPSPEEMQRRALRADGNFIGTGMLFLVALSQFLYTIVVLGLVFFHVIPYAYVGLNDLGLGNTSYLLLYMGVYLSLIHISVLIVELIDHPISDFQHLPPVGPQAVQRAAAYEAVQAAAVEFPAGGEALAEGVKAAVDVYKRQLLKMRTVCESTLLNVC